MSLFLTDFDQWEREYKAATPSQQYELIKAAIAEPIPPNYAKQLGLIDFFFDVQDILLECNQFDEYLAFWKTLQQQQPALYQKEFPYLDSFPIKYYLFQDRLDEVRNALSQFQANPVNGIDPLAESLEIVGSYSNAASLFVDLCRAVHQPIAQSPKLLNGSEIPFGNVVIFDLLEHTYEQLQQREPFDWEAFKVEALQYGLEDAASCWEAMERDLTAELAVGTALVEWFKCDLGNALRHLIVQFCREMKDRHDLPFITSHRIGTTILDCFADRELSAEDQAHLDEYFATSKTDLSRAVGKQIYTLLSMRPARGFIILWGIPLLYQFLQEKQVISSEVAEGAIAAAQDLQPSLIAAFKKSLWQFDFVHRWPRPASVSEAAFAAETEQFAASFGTPISLSDDPRENLDDETHRAWLQQQEQIAAMFPPPAINPPTDPENFPNWQPKKPRKSPIQEARDLGNPKKKGGKKKKKKKGFS